MISFRCGNCDKLLEVSSSRAGTKGRCPVCRQVVVVPRAEVAEQPRKKTAIDSSMLDLPGKAAPEARADAGAPDVAYDEQLAMISGHQSFAAEPLPERRLPWIIDIFLYPFNSPGLTILTICVGIPLLLRVIVSALTAFTMAFTPMFVFLVLFLVFFVLSVILFTLYIYWYMCECIRDSAHGGIRAPEIAGRTPGLGELLGQTFQIFICLLLCMAPALLYLERMRSLDAAAVLLYGLGMFFFPMGLLAVIEFESLRALNPLLVLGSILSTFLQYCGLVLLFYPPCILMPLAIYYLWRFWPLGFAFLLAAFYELLVMGHLMGRFHYRYQDSLNWDV